MTSLQRLSTIFAAVVLSASYGAGAASADSGHARIVRLSLVQGDVRFARDVKGDPLAESKANWEAAVLNLPIRQGYVVATDNGRAEVEFENGAMAFLAENTVLEFYDLSSEDGGFTTRLILRQGSAEFYVNPGRADYFSVTGGDFSVQAESKTTFRMNNYDDGSSVNVLHGRLTALANGKNTQLEKDQSLSLKAGEPDSMAVERVPANDEFDQWVSGRIDSVNTATSAAMQYSGGYGFNSGFGDLYTYGAWFPVAGYGYGWRPYGVGLGWCPFDYGSWYYDSFFWVELSRRTAVGLGTVSLRRLAVSTGYRMGVESEGNVWWWWSRALEAGDRSLVAKQHRDSGDRAVASAGCKRQTAAESFGRRVRSDLAWSDWCFASRQQRKLEGGEQTVARHHAEPTGRGRGSFARGAHHDGE